jgi:hypothetical protein
MKLFLYAKFKGTPYGWPSFPTVDKTPYSLVESKAIASEVSIALSVLLIFFIYLLFAPNETHTCRSMRLGEVVGYGELSNTIKYAQIIEHKIILKN